MSHAVPQQAHHIIPEAVFDDLIVCFIDVFGKENGEYFKQLGGNFIYLHSDPVSAEKAQALLAKNKNLFGDLAFGGAHHLSGHASYDAVVRERLKSIFKQDVSIEQKQMMVLDLQRGLKELLIENNPSSIMTTATKNDVVEAIDNALTAKNIYSPTHLHNHLQAEQLLNKFNNDKFLTRRFGTTGTDSMAKFAANKMRSNIKELDEITNFFTDSSQHYFDENQTFHKGDIDSPSEARQLIYRSTYDVEKFLSSATELEKITGKSLDKLTHEFKETLSLSLTHNLDDAKQARLANLKDSLKIQALDAKAVKLVADLRTQKKVYLDFSGVDLDKIQPKGSALWNVLDHIDQSGAFDDVELNGMKIKDWKAISVKNIDGVSQKLDFKKTIAVYTAQATELATSKTTGFDKEKFKTLDFHNSEIDADFAKEFGKKLEKYIIKFENSIGPINKSLYAKGLKKLPIIGVLLGASMAAQAANAATTDEEKKEIWANYAAGEIGSEVASWGAGIITGAILVGIGLTTGPVAIAAGLAVGIAAGIYGEEAGQDLYQLSKDLDGNGRADLLDRISTVIFGQDVPVSQVPEILKNSAITLRAEMPLDELISKAKEDIAYRYALRELNPFVAVGADYSRFNQDHSLDLWGLEYPQGMTDNYIRDRAQMLLLQMRYLKNGLKLGRNLVSDLVDGDRDYFDYGKHPFAGEPNRPLVFSLDGNGISIDDHVIAFGHIQNDILTGSGKEDRLYGHEGDDTLQGKEGNDYLEGGQGNDTYIIQGNDTLLDSDGQGEIYFDKKRLGHFKQIAASSVEEVAVWEMTEADKVLFRALRLGNDLYITDVQTSDSSVLIRDYFNLKSKVLNPLGIVLSDTGLTIEKKPEYNLYLGDQHAPVYGESKRYDWSKTYWNHKTGKLEGGINKQDFDDVIRGSENKDKIQGLGGNDALDGLDGDDWLDGGAGDDLIVGGAGSDRIFGGEGSDMIASDGKLLISQRQSENDQWNPPHNRDYFVKGPQWGAIAWMVSRPNSAENTSDNSKITIVNFPKEATINIISESVYTNNSQGDEIDAGNGNNIVYASHGDDKIKSGSGNDFIVGFGGNDVIDSGDGNDNIYSDGEESLTVSKSGNDIVFSGAGDDTIVAGGGNDIVYSGSGNDTIYGDYDSRKYKNIFGNDYLNGGDGNDGIWGGQGDDIIDGNNGNDRLYGEEGNDKIYGGLGNDVLWGLDGDDFLYGGDGDDFLSGDDGRLTEQGELTGHDYLYGGNGSDSLYGGKGNDHLYGAEGNDFLYGGEGDDYLYGGSGTDYLEGGKGINHLIGGIGKDFFRISQSDDQMGIDIIHDFGDDDALVSYKKGFPLTFIEMGKNLVVIPQYLVPKDIVSNNLLELIKNSPIKTIVKNFFNLPRTSTGLVYGHTVAEIFDLLNINKPSKKNIPPVILTQLQSVSAVENIPFTFTLPNGLFSDPDNDPLNINLTMADGSSLPNWLRYHSDTRTLSGTPGFEDAGSLNLRITATDSGGLSASQDWRIDVVNTNRAPEASGTFDTQTLKAGQAWSYVLPVDTRFRDPDGDRLDYRVVSADGSDLPAWLQYDAASRTLRGTPEQMGNVNLRILAIDGEGAQTGADLALNIEAKQVPSKPPATSNRPQQINGSNGHDRLEGGAGDDALYGKLGNDILVGGKGNDRLEGGLGNDTYVFNKGDGRDRIYDQLGNDTLRLQGLNADELWFERDGTRLKVKILGSDDEVSIDNHYGFGGNLFGGRRPGGVMPSIKGAGQIETFRLDNGRSLSASQADKLIQAMAAFRPQQGSNLSLPDQMQQYLQQINVSSYWK